MLGVARSKLERTPGCPVTLHEAGIEALPFEDACFDAVMVNQVLHHLPDSPHDGWPMFRRVLGEFARVVRPGGAAIINTCSHEQLRRGWWYTPLVPGVVEAIGRRHPDTGELDALIAEAGFSPRGRFVPTDATMQGDAYFDARGPLDPAWRRGDSLWSTVSEPVLETALDRIRALDEAGNARRVRRRARSHAAGRRAGGVPLRGPESGDRDGGRRSERLRSAADPAPDRPERDRPREPGLARLETGVAAVRIGSRRIGSDALRDCQNPVHLPQHRLLDQLAVDHDQAGVGFLEGPDDAARPARSAPRPA